LIREEAPNVEARRPKVGHLARRRRVLATACGQSTVVKALARAFRWRKLLETGVFATVEEMAAAEKINAAYVGRVLRLTLLAPDIVEAILDGRQPAEMTLAVLMRPFAVGRWMQTKVAHVEGWLGLGIG
jgi:hypothetical protein